MNWLSANRVKLHGMSDPRWGSKDIKRQYRGLVKLHDRDFAILENDHKNAIYKQKMKLKMLSKEIKTKRRELYNISVGNKQEIKNALSEHHELQLVCQELPPLTIIEKINQDNFIKRKKADLNLYKKKVKSNELIALKLRLSVLEDQLIYVNENKLPVEKTVQMLAGRIQDAILKTEAALAVRNIYNNIKDLMKRDAMYFDVILETLQRDSYEQGKCMIRTTELGQLATEYADDKRNEFIHFTKLVRHDMKVRAMDIKRAQEQLCRIQNNIKNAIRPNEEYVGKLETPLLEEYRSLKTLAENMEALLNYIKKKLATPDYESIYKYLEDQRVANIRLTSLAEEHEQKIDFLKAKLKQAIVLRDKVANISPDGTFEYLKFKKDIIKKIAKQRDCNINKKVLIKDVNDSISEIVLGMQRLCQTTVVVADDSKTIRPHKEKLQTAELCKGGLNIIKNMTPKVTKLINAASPLEIDYVSCRTHYINYILNRSRHVQREADVEEDLIDIDFEFDVPTNQDIKRRSMRIYEENMRLKEYE